MVVRKKNVHLGRAKQETGCDGPHVPGQPETLHFDEFLADAGGANQYGTTGRELAFQPHHAVTFGIHPSFPYDQELAPDPWRQLQDIATSPRRDFGSEQSNPIIGGTNLVEGTLRRHACACLGREHFIDNAVEAVGSGSRQHGVALATHLAIIHHHVYRRAFAKACVMQRVLPRTRVLRQLDMASVILTLEPGEDLIAGGRHGVGRESTEQSSDHHQAPIGVKPLPADLRGAGHLATGTPSASDTWELAAPRSRLMASRRLSSTSSLAQSPSLALVAIGRLRSW